MSSSASQHAFKGVALSSARPTAGWQREPGWPALLAKTRSWCDGFGIYGSNHGNQSPTIYLYVNEWNKNYVKCVLPLKAWSCLLMSYEWQGDSGVLRSASVFAPPRVRVCVRAVIHE